MRTLRELIAESARPPRFRRRKLRDSASTTRQIIQHFGTITGRRHLCSMPGMARPLRLHVPGMIYHVMSRGNDKQTIFTDDRDYERYLELLARSLHRYGICCLAYCLLGNHLHLLLQPEQHPISRLMHHVNSAYCQWFNRRHKRVGHVLQGRYKAVLVEREDSLRRVLRYIAMNPVHAKRVLEPIAWRWSGYRASIGIGGGSQCIDVAAVARAFDATDPSLGQRRFAEFVANGDDDMPLAGGLFVGSEAFARQFAPLLRPFRHNDAYVRAERFAARPSLAELFAAPESSAAAAAHTAFTDHAYTLREIGEHLKRPGTTVWAWIRRRRQRGPIQERRSGPSRTV